VRDFRRLADEKATRGLEHWGIVLSMRQYKDDEVMVGVRALLNLLATLDSQCRCRS
jgi:hypothetical protein